MEEEVTRVGKSASTGQLKAYIGDQWVNIANAEKTASGKYKITHLPKLAEEVSSTQSPSLLDTTLSAKDLVAGKKQVEEEARNLGEYDDSQDFVPGRMLKKMGKDIGEGLARTGMVEEKYRTQFKEFPKSKEGYRLATPEELPTSPKKEDFYVKEEKDKGAIQSVKDIVKGVKEDPLGTLKSIGKGLAEDPWQLTVPFVGRKGAIARAEQIAKKAELGPRATSTLQAGAGAANAAVNLGAFTGGTELLSQFGEGKGYKPGEIGGAMLASAPFAILGARVKDLSGMVRSGKMSTADATAKAITWLEEKGVRADPAQIEHAITNYTPEMRDTVTGALKKDVYGKPIEAPIRYPEVATANQVAEEMGKSYAMDLEKEFKLRGYAKQAEQITGGEQPPIERGTPTPEELGQTKPRLPIEEPVVEEITIPPVNASGESIASQEAINAIKAAKEQGIQTVRINAATGEHTPLIGLESRDPKAYAGQIIADVKPDGSYSIRGQGEDVSPNVIEGVMNRARARGLGAKEGGAIDPDLAKKMGIGAGVVVGAMVSDPDQRFTGALSGGLGVYALSRITAARVNKATRILDNLELEIARGVIAGKAPKQIFQELSTTKPEVLTKGKEASGFLNRMPVVPSTTQEALDLIRHYKSPIKQSNLAIGTESLAGIVSTRVRNISEPVARYVRNFERQILATTHKHLTEVDPFLKDLSKMDQSTQRDLFNGDFASAESKMPKATLESWAKVKETLDTIGDTLVDVGRMEGKHPNYFPRVVIDKEGLLKVMGVVERTKIEKALTEAGDAMIKQQGRSLNTIEESAVFNKVLRGYPIKEGKPGFVKQRKIDILKEEYLPFYATPTEALHSYIRNAVQDIEKSKFFGKNLKYKKVGEIQALDLDTSIGNLVRQEADKGALTYGQEQELKLLLNARFGAGERSPLDIVQDVKNIAYAGLLGNPISAATQLGDVAISAYINGLRPTLEAITSKISKTAKIDSKDFGLTDKIAEEFANTRKSAKFLNTSMKWSGFTIVDKLGKDITMNAAYNKYTKLANSAKGVDQIASKYQNYFAEDFPQFVKDLQSGKRTSLIDEFIFSEISDVQPISKFEMPQKYLENPNGRLFYMLKTFMLKQADIVRREAYNEIKKGNTAKGLSNLTKYALVAGAGGMGSQYIKDFIMGRDIDFDAIDIPINALKTFGWSEYTNQKINQGKFGEVAVNFALPPWKMFDQITALDAKSVQYIPVFGRLLYSQGLGGAEEFKRKQEQQDEKKEVSDVDKRLKELEKQMKGIK